MPKRTSTAVAALGVALALLLTGCAGTAPPPAGERTAPAASESAAPTPSDVPTGPVEVTTVPTSEPTADASQGDQWIADAARWFETKGVVITEDQVRAAADYSCDQIAAGADPSSLQPLTGDVAPEIVDTFVWNVDTYCPLR